MVQEILKNIDQKVSQELLRINSEKERAILELEKKYKEEAKKQKQARIKELEQKISSQIEETLQKKRLEVEFTVLKEKNNIIDDLYKEAGKRMASLPEQELKKWIKSLLPENIEGKIGAGKRTAVALRRLVNNEIEEIGEEGFIVVNNEVELDFSISEVLRQLREKQGPEIIKMLFIC